jgi:N-acetylneuraminic acid mutarotase
MSDLPDLLERFADEGGHRGAANVFAAAVDALGERQRRRRTRTVIAAAVALTLASGGIAAIAVDAHHDGLKVQTTTPAQSVAPAPVTTAKAPTTTGTISAPPLAAANDGAWSLAPFQDAAVGGPVVWTGKEVIVAGAGCCDDLGSINLTAYNPTTKSWRNLPATPLTPRAGAAGVWTGTELVVAGGDASADGSASHASPATDGAAWNEATNSWHRISDMPTTLAGEPTAVWTGREVLVWSSGPALDNIPGREVVLAYNPATDTWRSLPTSGLTPRDGAVTVWTGNELVVWGGGVSSGAAGLGGGGPFYSAGARLDPATSTWRRLPPAPVPARGLATAVWTGHEVLLWGGVTASGADVGKGAAYNPATDTWRALPASPLRAKASAASAWTGRFFIVIGGAAGYNLPTPGPGAAAYDPATNTWTSLPAAPRYPVQAGGPTFTADQREGAFAVWTGTSVVVLGGVDFTRQAPRSDGLVWTPAG